MHTLEMEETEADGLTRHRLRVNENGEQRSIAVLVRAGKGPPLVWLTGFRSEMRSVKATALDAFAAAQGRALVRFDYTGHGASEGRFEEAGLSVWFRDALAVLGAFVPEPPVLVGSSMGGWISLLVTRELLRVAPHRAPAGLVLIAPATDFTEELMWKRFPDSIRETVLTTGVYERPSVYGDGPYPITLRLIEDGRGHLLFGAPLRLGCPVHILQGMEDPDVPYTHALRLVEHLPGEDVQLTFVKDGDHRLSRPQDIERLLQAVAGVVEQAERRTAEAARRQESVATGGPEAGSQN
jgi:pimeloyl-ACP methyl ester carboxylesterase